MVVKQIIREDELVKITKSDYPGGYHMTPHTHEFSAISLVLKGGFEESVYGFQNEVCRSRTLIKPAEVLHSDRYLDACTILCIYLKDETAIGQEREVLREWMGIYGINWAQFHPYFLANSLVEKKESLRQFLKHLKSSKKENQEVPDWVYELKHYLDTHFHEVLLTSEIADRYEVHPVYLARVFRKYFGMSIKEYLKNLRIRNSMAAIMQNETALTEIAYTNGYADQSHFIRNFKSETGLTPKDFRKISS